MQFKVPTFNTIGPFHFSTNYDIYNHVAPTSEQDKHFLIELIQV